MKYTPVFVPVILAILLTVITLYRPPVFQQTANAVNGSSKYLQSVQAALSDAKKIGIFRFVPPCQKCHESNLTVQDFPDLPSAIPLNAADASFFVATLSDPASYILGGLQKAMPFIADYGLLLESAGGRRLLLISTYSQSVKLITADKSGEVLIGNIDPIFPEFKERLGRIFR
jgi:hypothetical protein